MNHILGTKFKILIGYKGCGRHVSGAGEGRDCRASPAPTGRQSAISTAAGLKNKDINVFVQFAVKKHPELPNVPLIGDSLSSTEDKSVLRFVFHGLRFARPFLAPPGAAGASRRGVCAAALTPPPRIRSFWRRRRRSAFDIDPVDGDDGSTSWLTELYATPKPMVERAKWALTAN